MGSKSMRRFSEFVRVEHLTSGREARRHVFSTSFKPAELLTTSHCVGPCTDKPFRVTGLFSGHRITLILTTQSARDCQRRYLQHGQWVCTRLLEPRNPFHCSGSIPPTEGRILDGFHMYCHTPVSAPQLRFSMPEHISQHTLTGKAPSPFQVINQFWRTTGLGIRP